MLNFSSPSNLTTIRFIMKEVSIKDKYKYNKTQCFALQINGRFGSIKVINPFGSNIQRSSYKCRGPVFEPSKFPFCMLRHAPLKAEWETRHHQSSCTQKLTYVIDQHSTTHIHTKQLNSIIRGRNQSGHMSSVIYDPPETD